jgi:hypothetical protein
MFKLWIVYRLMEKDTIQVEIDGQKEGQKKKLRLSGRLTVLLYWHAQLTNAIDSSFLPPTGGAGAGLTAPPTSTRTRSRGPGPYQSTASPRCGSPTPGPDRTTRKLFIFPSERRKIRNIFLNLPPSSLFELWNGRHSERFWGSDYHFGWLFSLLISANF